MAEDKTIGELDDGGVILGTDQVPVERAGENFRVTLAGFVAAVLNAAEEVPSVLTTDIAFIIRDGTIYKATAARLNAASPPPSGGGQFDFSDPDNSALAA